MKYGLIGLLMLTAAPAAFAAELVQDRFEREIRLLALVEQCHGGLLLIRRQVHVRHHRTRGTNLVFLDPDCGIQGKRLTTGHVALAEIAALRSPDRALIIGHQQSGRRSEVKFLADQMRSLGCDPVEIVRLRLVTSRFYVIADHDSAMTELIATFVRRWGDRIKAYSV